MEDNENIIKSSSEKRKSDIWLIYRDPEHLKDGLNALTGFNPNTKTRNITYTKDNPITIFVNLKSKFKIGNKEVEKPIGTYIYSKETDTSLMIVDARYTDSDLGLISAVDEDIISYFEGENIPYEIVFGIPPLENKEDNPNIHELWIARDKYVLEDSLKENLNNYVDECVFYPSCPVSLSIGYDTKTEDGDIAFREIFGFDGKGLIVSNFNWSILVQEGYKDNVKYDEVIEMLNRLNYHYVESASETIEIPSNRIL